MLTLMAGSCKRFRPGPRRPPPTDKDRIYQFRAFYQGGVPLSPKETDIRILATMRVH